MEKGQTAEDLLLRACGPSKKIKAVQGSIWLKTQSPELTGQFSATISAQYPDQLRIEFSNILGGSEAIVIVKGDHYVVTSAGPRPQKKGEGYGSWGGIPLRWATELFLGKIPCPKDQKGFQSSMNHEGDLVVISKADSTSSLSGVQQFTYGFRMIHGKPWAKSLHWERLGESKAVVDFSFDDPEEQTLSPKKWEIRSDRGAVKVKWQQREVNSD